MLDIGAWDGFFSFEAERRGAARVVAADYYAWHGIGWGTHQGKAGFTLARECLASRVEDLDIDVMDLSPERVGTFDVVLFLGVLYHLRHPLLALERIASVTRELLIVETAVDMVGVRRPAVAFYPERELGDDRRTGGARTFPPFMACCAHPVFSRSEPSRRFRRHRIDSRVRSRISFAERIASVRHFARSGPCFTRATGLSAPAGYTPRNADDLHADACPDAFHRAGHRRRPGPRSADARIGVRLRAGCGLQALHLRSID